MITISMKPESVAFGIAGVAFGLIAGWVIGTQQGTARTPAAGSAASAAAPMAAPMATPAATPVPQIASGGAATAPAALDESKVAELKTAAGREPSNPVPRVQLGNMYFDAERYSDAIQWYTAAVALSPRDVNLSTDLAVSYYYTNQPDKAIDQLNHSLTIDPKHTKSLLNMGIVKAFGKQDLQGAEQAWEQVLQICPGQPGGAGCQARARGDAVGASDRGGRAEAGALGAAFRSSRDSCDARGARVLARGGRDHGGIDGEANRAWLERSAPQRTDGPRPGVWHLRRARSRRRALRRVSPGVLLFHRLP